MRKIGKDLYKDWPAPFPMMLDSFSEFAYDPVPAIYMPTLLGLAQTLMQGSFVTTRKRGPNTNDDVISKTAGGKDDNSIEALNMISKEVQEELGANTSEAFAANLMNLLDPMNTSVTGITQFLEVAEPRHSQFKGVFLVDTEGENHFQNIGQTGGQAAHHSRAIVDAEIDAYNGNVVKGRNTKDSKIEPIRNPNISFVRMVQNEPYFNSLSGWMNTKGYIPRKGVWFDPDDREETPSTKLNNHIPRPDHDFIPFLIYAAKWFYARSNNKPTWVRSCLEGGPISDYEINVIYGEKQKELTDDEFRSIKRSAQLAEKYCTLIAGWEWCWKDYCRDRKHQDTEVAAFNPIESFKSNYGESFQAILTSAEVEEILIPLLDMFVINKIYLLEQLGSSSQDRLYELIHKAYNNTIKSKNSKYIEWTKNGLAPRELLSKKCKESVDLKMVIIDLKKKGKDWDYTLDRWIEKNGYEVKVVERGESNYPCVVPRGYNG